MDGWMESVIRKRMVVDIRDGPGSSQRYKLTWVKAMALG